MLFSEKNRMKVHKNQWLLTMLYPLVRLAGATSRGQTMAPEGQKPSKWLCLTKLPREMYPQPIVHKALSWGAIRKSACILAEITIRKSQISMDGRGRALDNVFVERLWRTVKYEEVYLKDYETPREAMQGLATFFVRYNEWRQHQALEYQTPAAVYFSSSL